MFLHLKYGAMNTPAKVNNNSNNRLIIHKKKKNDDRGLILALLKICFLGNIIKFKAKTLCPEKRKLTFI